MDDLNQRIAGLSPAKRALLELRLQQRGASAPTIAPRADRGSAPASFAQQRLWFLSQLELGDASYNVPRALRLQGPLNVDALRRALAEIVERHEVFRTRFASVDGELRQIITTDSLPLAETDLSQLPLTERESQAAELITAEAARPFDLEYGPVMRTSLIKLDELAHILLLTSHHIVSDAWSAEILFRELAELYDAFGGGRPSPLSPLPIQYADFAEWQRSWLQGPVLAEQLAYWKKQLAGVNDVLALPTDRPRPQVQTFVGAYQWLTLPKALSEQVVELSRRAGVTAFMTLLAAFDVLLSRCTGQEDIVVGSPIAGRNHEEIEGLIGFFVNTLVLRADLSGDPSFSEVLTRVREVALEAYAHQEVPFEKLVEELEPERSLAHSPLFQVMFAMHQASQGEFGLHGLTVEPIKTETNTAKFDLSLFVAEEADGLTCIAEYNTDLFDQATVERLLGHYQRVLEVVVANSEQRISAVPLLTETEREQLISEWNDTAAEIPEARIDELFESQVERTPDRVALKFGDQQLTFAELNGRANQLARHLLGLGVGPEVVVGICLERSPEMIVGLLGILKAGGVYVPLEPTYPAERLAFILEDSQARLLLTQQRFTDFLSAANVLTICLDIDWPVIARESSENPASNKTSENTAHLIYTSGSTGQPKGVLSSHHASVNRFAWMWRTYPFSVDEVCCQKTALSFVDSIWEIFGPLLQGVPLVIIPDETVKDPEQFVAALSDNKVTRLVLVPSLLRVILELGNDLAARLSHLCYCVCSGEALTVGLAQSFREQVPATKLINLYGSSEVAADVTCYEISNVDGLSTIPIGQPIANTQLYILDAQLQPVPVGVPGEIYVGGDGLARGYLNRPELTAEKFIVDPFHSDAAARLFRTGDVGRYLPDGNIEYRGRRDTQVKVRGFRIELGEIEAQLATHPQVQQVVVVARDDERGEKQLVAYVVSAAAPAINELRAQLRSKLPDHMIPAAFVFLDALPLTASGKVNRLALPAPDRDQQFAGDDFVAPRTQTEEILAGIWGEVLEAPSVGINDDFFALGGHSLLLARIAARIREAFQLELPLRTLFEAPTVATLAERIDTARRNADGLDVLPVVSVSRASILPLSFAQERLWFFDQLEPNSAAYNIPRVLRLRGPLKLNALRESFNAIVSRHEVLRTSFLNAGGKPALSIAANATIDLPVFDLSQVPASDRDREAKQLANRETQRAFDLPNGPLLRAALVRLNEDEHLLILTMHHIISDGWSVGVLMRELVACYNAFVSDNVISLPALDVQYVDYAAWQRQWLSGVALEKQLDYWRAQLAGAPPVIDLPLDRPRPALRGFRGARQSLTIERGITDKLKTLARGERVTLFMTLVTAFQALLAGVAKQDDIVVGSPSAGRNRPEWEPLIGYFVNTLVLRAQFSGDPEFRESLRRGREIALNAFANQDVPFEKLVEELQPARTLQVNPLFQVWFVLQNALVERQEFNDLTVDSLPIDSATTRHDLQLTLWDTANGLDGAFTYSTDLFEADTIACLAEQFNALLAVVVDQSDIRLSALRVAVSEAGRAYRDRASERLAELSREKLKSTRRKVFSAAMPVDEIEPMPTDITKPNAGRRRTISLSQESLVTESGLNGLTLPSLIQPAVDGVSLIDWAASNRELTEGKLLRSGALLFRGFNLRSIDDFERFMQKLAGNLLDYSYRSTPRTQVSGKVYTSTEYPAHQTIPLHNEMSYSRSWPRQLGFFCVAAAPEGGETPVADSRKVFARIDPAIRDRFSKQGVMYVRNYGDALDLSWQNVFQTDDRATVEAFCRKEGIEFEWQGADELRTRQICQAVAAHPRTGEMVWFNQAHLFHVSSLSAEVRQSLLASSEGEPPRNAYYGDGSEIEDAVLDEVRAAYAQETVVFPWQNGDILVVDNMLTAHGRKPYRGARKIVVAMG